MKLAALVLSFGLLTASSAHGQELIPGVYLPGPVGYNVVTLLANFNKGDVTFEPSLPVEDGRASIGGAAFGFGRTLGLAGRYANVGVFVPYVHGHVEGRLNGEFEEVTRSGLGDISARIAVNLYGARPMTPKEFASYRASNLVGVSLSVVVPVGRSDPSKVINISAHRWAFRPEIGLSHTRGHWTVEADIGTTFFTANTNYRNGGRREQAPIVALQAHLIYTIRPGYWLAVDGNFWHGGRFTTNGVRATIDQRNSRLGATLAVPIRRHQLRFAFSTGAYTTIGGDFHSIGVSYSYAWR